MNFSIAIGKLGMKLLYCFLKLFKTQKGKILFLSRQSNTLSMDFKMLKQELESQSKDNDCTIEIVGICNRMTDGRKNMSRYMPDLMRSMYHLATAEVVVLDSYWPTVSMLNHKKSLTVIQMWHSIGKIKKSGYQTLDKASGRSEKVARIMDMHRNYDIIIAGAKEFNSFYCKSFDTTEDKLCNIGLPRIDYLIQQQESNKNRVFDKYPEFKDKRVVLYAPTFRRKIELKWETLIENFNFDESVLIIKGHPNQPIECNIEGVYMCPEFSSLEILSACDYLITDYSAIALEGAVLNIKTYYFLYDYEEYIEKNGLNLSPYESMPGCVFRDGNELIEHLQSGKYNQQALDEYRKKYLPEDLGSSTRRLGELVLSKLA